MSPVERGGYSARMKREAQDMVDHGNSVERDAGRLLLDLMNANAPGLPVEVLAIAARFQLRQQSQDRYGK